MMPHYLFVGSSNDEAAELRRALNSSPHSVLDVASSPSEAHRLLSIHPYALAFVEEVLATSDFIRSLRDDDAALPVIALIASEDCTLGDKVLDAGAVDYLLKSEVETGCVARYVRRALAQREAWLSLRSSEERHRLLMHSSGQGLWHFDFEPAIPLGFSQEEQVQAILERAHLVECNDAKAQMYGFSCAADMQGIWLRDVTHADEAAFTAFLRQFVDSNYVLRDTELMEFDRNGEPKYFLCNVTGIIEDGHLVGAWGAQSDITAAKQSEITQSRLSAIIESSQDQIFSVSLEGVLQSWNRGAEEILGYSAEEAIGQSLRLVVPPEEVAAAQNVLAHLRRGERVPNYEAKRRHKDGTLRDISMSVAPVFDAQGNVTGMWGIGRDITKSKRAEEELRRSEKLYHTLARHFPNGSVYLLDLEGRFLLAEGQGLNVIGLKSEEVIGRTVSEIFGSQGIGAHLFHAHRQAVSGVEVVDEVTIQGHSRSVRIVPIRDEQDSVISVLAVTQDVTEQKRARAALERSEKLYHTLASHFPNGSVLLLDRDLRFVLADGLGLAQLGLNGAEMIGKTVGEVFGPIPGGEGVEELYQQALLGQAGDAEVLLDGTHWWIHVVPIWENGEVSGVMGMSQDISALKQTEQALRNSEERLRAFLDNTPATVFIRDEEGRYVYLNKAISEFIQQPVEQVLGKTIFDGVAPELAQKVLDNCSQVLESDQAQEFETVLPGPDGTLHNMIIVKFPLTESDGKRLVAGVGIDITERKRAEEELLRSQQQLTLAQSIAHLGHIQHDEITDEGFWSDEVYRILGLEPQAFPGSYQKFFEFVHPDDAKTMSKSVGAFAALPEEVEREFRIVRPNGEVRWVRAQIRLPRDHEGHLLNLMGTILDITDIKTAQDERDRFFELSPDLLVISDERGYFKRVNPAWNKVLGYQPEELLSQPFIEFVHPDDQERTIQEASHIYAGGEAAKIENRYRCRDGSYRLLEWNTISRLSTGLLYSVASDITERRKAEVEVLESRNRLASIVNSAMDAIITTDASMRIVMFNPAAEKMFGYTTREMLGQSISVLVPHRLQTAHATNLGADQLTGAISGLRANGEEFPVEASSSQIQLEDQTLFTVILRDITERQRAEEELRASRERLQLALQSGQIGLWEWNFVDNSTYASEFYKRQLGYEGDEFNDTIETHLGAVHPEDRVNVQREFGTLLRSDGCSYQHEFRMRHKDGGYRWILSQGTVFRDTNGKAERLLGSHIDITNRKQVEEQLLRGREELQHAHDDLERRVQKRTQQLAKANEALRVESIERRGALLALQEAVHQLEHARDESERANTELRANEERLLHGHRMFTELTKLRVAKPVELEEALRAITRAGTEVLDLERCSVWLYNEGQTGIRCLDLYEREIDQHSHELELFVEDFPNYFRALQTKESILADDAHTHPATGEFSASYLTPLGISSMLDTPIVLGGQMVGVLCCEQVGHGRHWKVEDLTSATSLASICSLALESLERARAEEDMRQANNKAEASREEAERANLAKSEFLSRMSHELRTPMNSILGFAQILEMTLAEEKQTQRVKLILKAGRHLLQLINEVLDVARVESGHLSLSPEPVPVKNMVQMAADLVRPLYQQNNLQFHLEMEACSAAHVWADQQRLSQVMLNLLSNAGKYNRKGGNVTVRCEERPDNRLRINFMDTGQGIEPQFLPKIFQPFERLGREGGSIEGTGLGLSLSKGLIEAMKGMMGVESEFGVGSNFWVELPLANDPIHETDRTHTSPLALPAEDVPAHSHTILYIEDNVANLQVLEHLLKRDGQMSLVSAMQGQMGIELARQHRPSLILLDLHLPDIAGDEVLRRILAEPELCHIPVVMVSADATPSQIVRLLAAGASEYLTKPLDLKQLLSVIYKHLGEGAPRQLSGGR